MKVGGAFSGIGGFETAAVQLGWEVAWTCESDPDLRAFLTDRFAAPCYPDVRDLDPTVVEPVDVFVGGSPCQGFSVAGARKGMGHAESGLFADYVRLVDGLVERGLRYAVWENVPGLLSLTDDDDDERTWEHVVAALAGSNQPVRLDRREPWYAGLAVAPDGRRAVGWRTLDARHFGVPQRRRRVFACVALGDTAPERALQVLLVGEGVSGDSAACGQEGQDVAGTLGARLGSGGPDDNAGQQRHVVPANIVAQGVLGRIDRRNGSRSDGATGAGTPGTGIDEGDGPATSVTSVPSAVVTEAFTFDRANVTSKANRTRVGPGRPADPIAASNDVHAVTRYGVRRLTPIEAERLQGFADGYTEPLGSDSARYRGLGNAVCVPVVRWILERIEHTEGEHDA